MSFAWIPLNMGFGFVCYICICSWGSRLGSSFRRWAFILDGGFLVCLLVGVECFSYLVFGCECFLLQLVLVGCFIFYFDFYLCFSCES